MGHTMRLQQGFLLQAFALTIHQAVSQTTTALNFQCGPYDSALTRLDRVVVCIEYDSDGDGTGDSYAKFHPKVDDLSEFQGDEVNSANYWNANANASTQIRGVVGDKVTPWVAVTQKNSNNQVVSQVAFLTLM